MVSSHGSLKREPENTMATNDQTTRLSWRRDLAAFRGLTDQEKAGYLPVLEWFESFRSQRGLEPGSEAAEAFWKIEVVPKDRPRESAHLQQWQRALDWYLRWLSACAEEKGDPQRLPIRAEAAVKAACVRLGMAPRTAQCYGRWVRHYATFAGSEREMKKEETANRFLVSVTQDKGRPWSTRKQAINAVVFYFRNVCGLNEPVFTGLGGRSSEG